MLAREYHRWREPIVSSTVPRTLPIYLQVTSAKYTKSYSARLISLFSRPSGRPIAGLRTQEKRHLGAALKQRCGI